MATTKQGVVLARVDGRSMRGQAGEITFKIGAAESGGAYSTWEYLVRPGGVSSAHYHRRIFESWYVLEGRLEICLGERWSSVGVGTMVLIPVGVVHAFRNPTDEPARMLFTAAPAGWSATSRTSMNLSIRSSPDGTPTVASLRDLNRKHDFVLVEA